MSYGIVRIQKMTSGSVRGIDIHDNRIKEFSHTNKDIDWTKTESNYKLKEKDKSFYNSVNDRIKELKLSKAVRKDAVVMSQALVTSDKPFFDGLSKEQQEDFFKKSYEFLENRYGKENIISATVHLDEKTPHMHVNFVPVTSDGRLCAKDLLNRKEMQSLQNNAYDKVFKSFGLERGEAREEKRKHLTTEEYKIETKKEDLKNNVVALMDNEKKIKEKTVEIDNKISELQKAEKTLAERTKAFNKSVEGFNKRLGALKGLNAFEIQKELLGGKYKLIGSKEEMDTILEYAKKGVLYDDLKRQYDKLNNDYERDRKYIPSIDERMKLAKDKQRLEQLEKIYDRLPHEIREQLLPTKTQNKGLSHGK